MKTGLCGIGLLISCLILSGQTFIDRKIQYLNHTEAKIDSLMLIRDRLLNESSVLAKQIRQQKMGEQRSYSEHKKLERQLQDAQLLNRHISQYEQELNRLHQQMQDTLRALDAAFDDRLENLMRSAQNNTDEKSRGAVLQEFEATLVQKSGWSQRIDNPAMTQTTPVQLDVTPWDNASSLLLKKDALLDQEEFIRQEISVVDQKIKSLVNEVNMRRKMAEMTGDLSLFSENEETMDRLVLSGHTDARNIAPVYDGLEANDSNTKYFYDKQNDDLATWSYFDQRGFDAESSNKYLSTADRIDILSRYRENLISRADSLKQRARWFEEQAEDHTDRK
jgi:hypothetical protein